MSGRHWLHSPEHPVHLPNLKELGLMGLVGTLLLIGGPRSFNFVLEKLSRDSSGEEDSEDAFSLTMNEKRVHSPSQLEFRVIQTENSRVVVQVTQLKTNFKRFLSQDALAEGRPVDSTVFEDERGNLWVIAVQKKTAISYDIAISPLPLDQLP